ncbi:MAG: AAA family ATPase [Nocardiopsaceae bacterium]|nr:AAA family ATPase [Nocardiopsaceae bacterium]
MSIALNLLDGVRWRGRPVAGKRPGELLAALAAHDGRPVPAEKLIGLVWGDDPPANGVKGLQVLVARTRNACGSDAIVRDGAGYRLGIGPDEVDSIRLARLVRDASAALDQDAVTAAKLAQEALALVGGLDSDGVPAGNGLPGPGGTPAGDIMGNGALVGVRQDAAADIAAARVIAARARSRTGACAQALPVLESAHSEHPHDEALLADLLNAEAAVRGPAAALDRFERYREALRGRLGTDPGEALQRAHRRLLALDRPVRRGVRYDATELIGRDGDLERLRSLLASSRVVSITGPGGLGKTRLAHALARDAAEPAVYVVELAGVTSPEDVALEVGSALGVRDSVRDRRLLTPRQRADAEARIAQHLAQSPCLLMLDNCEHLIGAVADLVAYLVTAVADLRVLTTSRAPLAIAAERVYPLGELGASDSGRLFTERALAARPGARLPDETVASIVARLDGLPLAIELAAAKVRAMSADEIDRRLEDRFALLRGGDRSAPDRHQALLTVIEWSWNLLNASEQRALRWLALFHDGFTLEAAETVLAQEGLARGDAFQVAAGLVDQSLLSVRETAAGLRYRMLETVREFGVLRLADAGEERAARASLRRWAVGYARAYRAQVMGSGQFEAIDALSAEETNLADELRGAIADDDHGSLAGLLATLGLLWTIRGQHVRIVVLAEAVTAAMRDWEPPADLADEARTAMAIMLANSRMTNGASSEPLEGLLRRLGPMGPRRDGDGYGGYSSGLARMLLAYDPDDVAASIRQLARLAEDDDRATAIAASQWLTHLRENAGDPAGATAAAERTLALVRDDDGPWSAAMAHVFLAELATQADDRAAAVAHTRAALPVMSRLGATDDEIQLRSLLALCAIADGRLPDAEDELARLDVLDEPATGFASSAFRLVCHGELALARGDHAAGLRFHRKCATYMRELRMPGIEPTGMEPWALFGESMALAAHAYYAEGEEIQLGRALLSACRRHALRTCADESSAVRLDYPAAGLVLFALGTWTLLRPPAEAVSPEDASYPDVALRLLALADRFRYHRTIPTLMWERIVPMAEKAAPGRLARFQAEYASDEPAGLLAEAGRLVERLPG